MVIRRLSDVRTLQVYVDKLLVVASQLNGLLFSSHTLRNNRKSTKPLNFRTNNDDGVTE